MWAPCQRRRTGKAHRRCCSRCRRTDHSQCVPNWAPAPLDTRRTASRPLTPNRRTVYTRVARHPAPAPAARQPAAGRSRAAAAERPSGDQTASAEQRPRVCPLLILVLTALPRGAARCCSAPRALAASAAERRARYRLRAAGATPSAVCISWGARKDLKMWQYIRSQP
jgi:hypothetical protein